MKLLFCRLHEYFSDGLELSENSLEIHMKDLKVQCNQSFLNLASLRNPNFDLHGCYVTIPDALIQLIITILLRK